MARILGLFIYIVFYFFFFFFQAEDGIRDTSVTGVQTCALPIYHTFGHVTAVQCTAARLIPERVDEQGRRYAATADDAAYATFALAGATGEILAQFNSSRAVRVYRDDLLQIQVDGTRGRAVAALR